MITRRCLEQTFLLRPSPIANELFRYILAVAVKRHGIRLHAYCVLSNHFHLVLTDVEGKLPAFEQYLDSLVARAFNALHNRSDYFWSAGSYSAATLVRPADVLDKAAYVLANPVAAELVRTGSEWPGLWSAPERIGGDAVTAHRPQGFFRQDGPMPATAALELVCPPGFESADAFRAELVASVKEREADVARRMEREGRSFAGPQHVLAEDPHKRSAPSEPKRALDPHLACKDPPTRMEAIRRLKEFRAAYRAAWRAFARGVRDALFPHGTYRMRVMWGVCCAPA